MNKAGLLPVHGFVLAGGKSSRMGVDKAMLEFCGRPLVEIAVAKLRMFCADVSIVGREDLCEFGPVVQDERADAGPAAGIEAGLHAAKHPWALFIPVDVPLVPRELLDRWAGQALEQPDGMGISYLITHARRQPAFCIVRADCVRKISAALDRGERGLEEILGAVDGNEGDSWLWLQSAERLIPTVTALQVDFLFQNLNTPQEFDEAELWRARLGSVAY